MARSSLRVLARPLAFAGDFHAEPGCERHRSVRRGSAHEDELDAFLISTGLVSIAEIGDKTMLLAIMLAAAWRRPLPILLGIFVATLGNHAFAALAGTVLGHFMQGDWVRWAVGLAFLGFAVWALIPDRFDEAPDTTEKTFAGVFWTTTAAFFVIEMGDKTQVATAVLAAQFQSLPLVVVQNTPEKVFSVVSGVSSKRSGIRAQTAKPRKARPTTQRTQRPCIQ